MLGWSNNKPVISILGRKDASIRHPNYQINESEFIECMSQLDLNLPYLFFFDHKASSKIGVFIENSNDNEIENLEEQRSSISRSIHLNLLNLNERYALANSGPASKHVPVYVYFVETGTFMNWTIFRAEKTGTKSTNQIKLPRVALNDQTIQYFFSKVI